MLTSTFLNQVKLKAALPTGRFTDQEILNVAYDLLLTDVQPFLISIREEYYVKKTNTSTTSGTASYPIDSRALGLSLRELKYTEASTTYNLIRISPEDVNETVSGLPTSFYLEGVNIILYPTPSSSGTLIQSYFQRVNKPIETSEAAIITAITSNLLTAATPSTWTTSNTFDFISRYNGNDTLSKNLVASSISSGTNITFTLSDIPASLAVGDYVALAGESPYIQVPDEVANLVILLTCTDLMESMGDTNGAQMSMAKSEKAKQSIARVLANRVQGESLKFRPTI